MRIAVLLVERETVYKGDDTERDSGIWAPMRSARVDALEVRHQQPWLLRVDGQASTHFLDDTLYHDSGHMRHVDRMTPVRADLG